MSPSPVPLAMRRSLSPALPLLILLAASTVHIFFAQAGGGSSIHARGLDDAYISFRYAENLVRGEGLVYNPGERVEGFSNLLHVLVAAAFLPAVGRDGIYVAVSIFNMVLLGVGLLIFHRHAGRRLGARAGCVASILLALAPPLWAWSASAMESILVWTLQLWTWRLVDGWTTGAPASRRLAVALGLLTLARVDGFVTAAIVVGFFLLRREPGQAARIGGMAGSVVLLLFVARRLYFGTWIPRTFSTHVDGSLDQRLGRSIEHLVGLGARQGYVLYLLILLVPVVASLARRRPRGIPFGSFFAGALVAYWLYIGGDHFGDRFLLITLPLGIVAWLEALRDVPRAWRRLGIVLALAVQLQPLVASPRFVYGTEHYDGWIALGRYLGERYQGELVAVDAGGKIPFFSGLPAVDMRGLTEPESAFRRRGTFAPGHGTMSPDYILSRRPRLIATWIWTNLNAATGLSRALYRSRGYRVALLVNTTPKSREPNVLDVRGWTEEEIGARVGKGYRLAVLEAPPGP